MKIRFIHARIVSMCDKFPQVIEDGELHTENDRITYVGDVLTTEEASAKTCWDREIDCQGDVLMPGFKDAHTHSPMTFLRSFADDLPLDEWLHKQVFPAEAKLTPEDIYHLSKVALLEYISGGITANFDMYAHFLPNAQASIDLGFRTVFCGSVNDFTGSVPLMEEEYEQFNSMNDLISYQLGFHAEYTTSPQLIKDIAKLADKKKAPVYMHCSETAREVAQCQQRYGLTPPAYLAEEGIFEHGGGGFHFVHMTEDDLRLCGEKQIFAITCPASNLKLASGIAPLTEMMQYNIPLAIGTDGPASNNCLDMFREMFLATALQKYICKDASAMPAGKVLYMATTGSALAMHLSDCDVLDAGKKADIIRLDLRQPNMQPVNDIVKNIVYSGSKSNVAMTMINGNILYENGEFKLKESCDKIYATANEITRRIHGGKVHTM